VSVSIAGLREIATALAASDLPALARDVELAASELEAERARAAEQGVEQWGFEVRTGKVLISETKESAQHFARRYGRRLMRRVIGPWEVQS
jgi:putative intracellular protease/amidase